MANLPPKPSSYIPEPRHLSDNSRGMAPMRNNDDRDSRIRSDRRSPPRHRSYVRDSYVAPNDRRDGDRYKGDWDDRGTWRDRERDRDRHYDRRVRDPEWDRDRDRGRDRDHHHRDDWRARDRDSPPREAPYDHRDRRSFHDWRRDGYSRRDRPRRDDSPPHRPPNYERSPRRPSTSPRRTDYRRPRSRSRSPRRDSRSPSPKKQPRLGDHVSSRSPVPPAERTPKRPRETRSPTPSPPPPPQRHSPDRQGPSSVMSLSSGRRPDTEIKVESSSHTPNIMTEDVTEKKPVLEENTIEQKPPHSWRSPPRGPRNHHMPRHQGIPPSKPERLGRTNISNGGIKSDSQAGSLRGIPEYKPFRNVAIEKEIARLQAHRTNLRSEYGQIARASRRALHEQDMSTIELRAAENRRKITNEHLEKARLGILGIDAVTSTV